MSAVFDKAAAMQATEHSGDDTLHGELARARLALAQRDRELQEAAAQISLLTQTLDATTDGVLTVRHTDGTIRFNLPFVRMWRLPQDTLPHMTREQIIALQAVQTKDPAYLTARARALNEVNEQTDFSVIELTDGRILERYVTPMRAGGRGIGAFIVYRDVTQRVEFEQQELGEIENGHELGARVVAGPRQNRGTKFTIKIHFVSILSNTTRPVTISHNIATRRALGFMPGNLFLAARKGDFSSRFLLMP